MLNLTELNKIIEKRQEEKEREAKEKTFEQFLLIKDQVEAGILAIAAGGMRSGEFEVYTKFELTSSADMEREIMRHYSPIDFRIDKNLTQNNAKTKRMSYFTLDIFIPSEKENNTFGLDIMK